MTDNNRNYKVGFGRPPKNNQFQKGQSGNPSGRPRGTKNLATMVDKMFREPVRVKGEDGRHYYMPKIEVILAQLLNQAAKGEIRATRMCFEIAKMFPSITEPPVPPLPKFVINFVEAVDGRPANRVEPDLK